MGNKTLSLHTKWFLFNRWVCRPNLWNTILLNIKTCSVTGSLLGVIYVYIKMYLMSNPLQPFYYNILGELMCFSQILSKVQVKTHYRHFTSCFVTLPQTKTQGHFTDPSLPDSFYKQVSLDRKHFMTKPMSAAKQLQLRFDNFLLFSPYYSNITLQDIWQEK